MPVKSPRVLVAQIPMPLNRFLVDLNEEIGKTCSLHHSSDDFWEMRGDFDIVHLHFPEHLTYEIEQGNKVVYKYDRNDPMFVQTVRNRFAVADAIAAGKDAESVGGHMGIFGRPPGKRYPMVEKKGPSLAGIFERYQAMLNKIKIDTAGQLKDNVATQINVLLQQRKKGAA